MCTSAVYSLTAIEEEIKQTYMDSIVKMLLHLQYIVMDTLQILMSFVFLFAVFRSILDDILKCQKSIEYKT